MFLATDTGQPKQESAKRIQCDHKRIKRKQQPAHRPEDGARGRFGVAERDGLGNHLAEENVEVGQGGNRKNARSRVGRDEARIAQKIQPGFEPHRECVLAVHPQAETGHGDAELGGGDKTITRLRRHQQRQQFAREASAQFGASFDGHPRHRHDRKLRRDKQRIGEQQGGDDEDRDHVRASPRNSASTS